jgi:hypothetical protein
MNHDRIFASLIKTDYGVFRCEDQVIVHDASSRWVGQTGHISRLHGSGDPEEGSAVVEFGSGDETLVRLEDLEVTGY